MSPLLACSLSHFNYHRILPLCIVFIHFLYATIPSAQDYTTVTP